MSALPDELRDFSQPLYGVRRVFHLNRILLAVGLIFMTHLLDIIIWTYALIALKIFEVDTNAFYFVGEMYTTIGYGTFRFAENWRILPIMVAFTGIFAASMSGAILFNMIGQIIRKNPKK